LKDFWKSHRTLILLGAVLVLGFALRVEWSLHPDARDYPRSILAGGPGDPHLLGYDGVRYDWIAVNFMNGRGFGYHPGQPESWRPPGYPFFLVGCYEVFGHHFAAVRVIQAGMGCLIILLVFLLARHFTRSDSVALAAAGLYAFCFDGVLFSAPLYSETLCSMLIVLSIWLLVFAEGKTGAAYWIRAGSGFAALQLAVLVRPGTLILLLAVLAYELWKSPNQRRIQIIALAAASFCVVILPWTIRNYQLHHKFVLVSSNGGQVFFLANHPKSFGTFVPEHLRFTPAQKAELDRPGLDAVDKDAIYYRFGWEFIRSNPGRFLYLIYKKQAFLWTYPETKSRILARLHTVPLPLIVFNVIALAALPGLVLGLREFRRLFLLYAAVIAHCAVLSVLFYYHGPRTRIELLPFLCVFAAIGAAHIRNWARSKRREPAS
jgi:4-amino-4-deoxy-L-arabinose transferase-like glycosyltransferase